MLSELSGAALGLPEIAVLPQAPSKPYDRRLLCLAFLAPDIQRDILAGRQPPGLSLQRLVLGGIPAGLGRAKGGVQLKSAGSRASLLSSLASLLIASRFPCFVDGFPCSNYALRAKTVP
jgi:hypothetical protein